MSGLSALERLKQLVITRTGHHYYIDKDKLLYDRARERMRVCGVGGVEEYVGGLERGDAAEWRHLEDAITVGETYFFRYPDHFSALREEVLPRLIAARRDVRSLRIWSIGCSNGAEPYSVAILLRELLHDDDINSWRISLTGGDISEKALSAARGARYNAWALRTMGPEDRAKYFDRDGQTWVLKREFRSMVRFERQNILDLLSPAPPLEWTDFDLILCRNVLIYFSPEQAVELSTALSRRLAPDGVLFLGHAEATLATNPALWQAMPRSAPTEFVQALQPLTAVQPFVYAPLPLPDVKPAPLKAEAPAQPAADEDTVAAIQELADAGAYEAAEQVCARLIARSPTSAQLQYYAAILRQVSDDAAGAEAALRRALYLDRSFAIAHYRLGMLLLGLGRTAEARRSLMTAARLAEALPAGEPLPEGQGVLASDLADALRQQLAMLGEAA